MSTPNGTVITAAREDGTTVDLTEGVQCLYDLVINSMDWGSGFISAEEALPVAEVARACGFEQVEEVEKYVRVAAGDECPRCASTDKADRREVKVHDYERDPQGNYRYRDGRLIRVERRQPCDSLWHGEREENPPQIVQMAVASAAFPLRH